MEWDICPGWRRRFVSETLSTEYASSGVPPGSHLPDPARLPSYYLFRSGCIRERSVNRIGRAGQRVRESAAEEAMSAAAG